MELNEKLVKLRKQRGLTQEELAQALFVSRTAVSKWESGRGYPNLDSLKAIAKYFSVTIDELLSGDEIISIAEDELKQKQEHFCDLMFGVLDMGALLLAVLPFFAQSADGMVRSVSLLVLANVAPYLKWMYCVLAAGMAVLGILELALRHNRGAFWNGIKRKISLLINGAAVLLLIAGRQPYAAVFTAIFLAIKVWMMAKRP